MNDARWPSANSQVHVGLQCSLIRLDTTGSNQAKVFKMGQPRPLLMFIFGLFKQTSLQILQQINVKKFPSSIRCRVSNPQPSQHESPPITTRSGLPPRQAKVFIFNFRYNQMYSDYH